MVIVGSSVAGQTRESDPACLIFLQIMLSVCWIDDPTLGSARFNSLTG